MLDLEAGRVTLFANAAPRRALLERLAWEAGFELDALDVHDEPITVNAVRVEPGALFPLLLPDRPYRVAYRFDPIERIHLIERLEVGLLGTLNAPDAEGEAASEGPTPLPPYSPADPVPGATVRIPDGIDAREWDRLLDKVQAPDWVERVEAVQAITPEDDGLRVLIKALASDENAKVRAAAVEQLEDSETRAAVAALVHALLDPDREVVLAAIDALEFTDDETIADDLRPLERHRDPEVRESAAEAICFIVDCDE